MTKTLLLSDIFPPRTGGSGRWFWEIYRRLPRHAYVILAGEDPRQDEFDASHDLNLVRAPLALSQWGLRSLTAARGYLRIFQTVRRLARAEGINRLHCGRCLPEGWVALLHHLTSGTPYTCYIHGEDVETAATSRELSWMVHRILNHAEYLIANCRNTARLLEENWHVPESRIRILHPGVDADRFVPAPRDSAVRQRLGWDNRTTILTVGRLQQRKGQDMLIRALREIRQFIPDVLYCIIGSGEERESLARLVNELQLADHVQFLDEVNDQTMICCYQQCDLFALPNRQVGRDIEGFGMVLLEAQACGRPVLAGASGGTAETMLVGETGCIVPCEAAEPLAHEIIRLLSNPFVLQRMGEAGRRWVISKFDWRRLACQAAELFGDHRSSTSGESPGSSPASPSGLSSDTPNRIPAETH